MSEDWFKMSAISQDIKMSEKKEYHRKISDISEPGQIQPLTFEHRYRYVLTFFRLLESLKIFSDILSAFLAG